MVTAKSVLLRRQKEEYNKFSKAAGLLTRNERARVYGVDKSGNGGIINTELIRKKSEISRSKYKFISDATFNNLTIEARKNGAVIYRGTPDVEAHLDKSNAAASIIGDIILFREKVTISEVLEETHHFMQNINHINDDKGEPLRTILNEIDAKEYLISSSKKYKIPRIENDETIEQLAYYRQWLDNYNKE